MTKWRLSPVVCERVSDGTLWTPASDMPFPLNGWNFVKIRKVKIGWILDMEDRWIFTNPNLFEIKR